MALVATNIEPLRNRPIPLGQLLIRPVRVTFPATYVQGEPFAGPAPAINAGPGTQLNVQQLGFRKVFGVIVMNQSISGPAIDWNSSDGTLRVYETGAGNNQVPAELAGGSAHFANAFVDLLVIGI